MANILITLLKNPLGLIAAATPFIVKSIDNNRAKLDAATKLRDSEVKSATELAMEITGAVDRVVHLNREAIFGIMFRGLNIHTIKNHEAYEPDRKAWETYQTELFLWNSSRTSRHIRVSATFGRQVMSEYPEASDRIVSLFVGLTKQIELLENMADAAFYDRVKSRFFIENPKKPSGPTNVEFLIDLLKINPVELPGLVETINGFCPTGEDATDAARTDFRCKYNPIHKNCQKELLEIGALMLGQIRAQQVSALRYG